MIVVVASVGVGYLYGRIVGYMQMYESYAMAHCSMLFLASRSLVRGVDASGLNGLIDAVESNGDLLDDVIRGWQICAGADENEKISEAIKEWETAKRRLEQLRRLYETSKDPNKVENRNGESGATPRTPGTHSDFRGLPGSALKLSFNRIS
jgi:hypothetical protein